MRSTSLSGVGKMTCPLNLACSGASQLIITPQVALVAVLLAYLFLAFRMRPLGLSFVFGTEMR
jgi:hypothetical protein